MPSFWPDIRLDVLYVAVVVAVLKSAYKGEKRPRRRRRRSAARSLCSFMFFHHDTRGDPRDVEDIETDVLTKAGHLNRPQCKVMIV